MKTIFRFTYMNGRFLWDQLVRKYTNPMDCFGNPSFLTPSTPSWPPPKVQEEMDQLPEAAFKK